MDSSFPESSCLKISRACQVEVNDFKYYDNFIVSNLWSVFSKEIHHRDGWWWFVRGLLHGGWPCGYAGLSGSGNDLSCSLNYSTLWACQDIQQDGVDRISTAFYSLVLITS